MNNPAMLSYRNEVTSVSLANGTVVHAGSLANLNSRQLADGVTLAGGDANGCWLDIAVRAPNWGAGDPGVAGSFIGMQALRVVGLLGLNLPEYVYAPSPSVIPRIRLYAHRYTGGAAVWDLLADEIVLRPHRDPSTDGATGLVNLFLTFANPPLHPPLPGWPDPGPFLLYRLNIALAQGSNQIRPQIGKIWLGNAVVFKQAIEGRWRFGTYDPGTLDDSKGGQVYDSPAQMLKTLDCAMPVGGIDLATAFGIGSPLAGASIQGIQVAPGNLSEASRIIGSTQPCILAPLSVDPLPPYDPNTFGAMLAMARNLTIYGRMTNGIQIEHETGTPAEAQSGYRLRMSMREER